ncbi:restriction endonuclease subunit S [Hymenobacter metallicola]|uniref:Restriction endonuclease subunit S n=1 Tax=Hymenobacter metallicola TaxID=2563114 RepID=A0A4Z0PT35_9BACT|nr:restriction endonuclease subunit S [Hymenobacter metallicola]TGE20887.1 restriction endonuclease subunit S [Hymenobacter metallicola]
MKQYENVKESGAEWLGKVPTHWPLKKLKHTVELNSNECADEGITFKVALENIESGTGKHIPTEVPGFEGIGNTFQADDVLFSKLRPYLAKVLHPKTSGIAVGEILVLTPNKELYDSRFLFYQLLSSAFISVVDSSTYGSKMPRASWSFIKELQLPVPPLSEQRIIANFLDRKTEKLEKLLTHKQDLLDLLQRKRQAFINEAVTEGLNSLAPRKSSGVEWLGELPAHWEVRRLKTVSQFITSGSRGWAEYYSDEGSIFLRIGNLSSSSIDLKLHNLQRVTPPSGSEGERTRVQPNDLLISITALLGAVGVVPQVIEEAYVNQHIALVRLNQDIVHPRWVAYFLSSPVGKHQFKTLTNGGTKEGLTLGDITSLVLPYPSYEEQCSIVDYIETRVRNIDKAASAILAQIETLKAYRQALISEVVTGKVDVRTSAAASSSAPKSMPQQLGLFE